MLRFLYIILSYLLIPVILLYLLWKSVGNPDYRRRIPERFGYSSAARDAGVIWVHAASVGEVQAAAALIEALLDRYPEITVLVTTVTPTGSDRVRALFGERVQHCYAPLDLYGAVRRFCGQFTPRVAIILETELWPNLFHECARRSVPIVLASGRLSEKSVQSYQRFAGLFRDTLAAAVVRIAAQTEADAARFVEIGAGPEQVQVTGNIKFDFAVPAGVEELGIELRERYAAERPTWVAASTHAGEEEICIAAHQLILKAIPQAVLILVPRHPERFDGVATLLDREGLSYVRRSEGMAPAANTPVVLGDTMGELMAFYAAADVAFVGGSLVDVGGHNLLEPAALRLPMLSGPYTHNATDIAQLMHEGGALETVTDATTLARGVLQLFDEPQECRRRGKNAATLIEQNRGALEKVLAILEPLLAETA